MTRSAGCRSRSVPDNDWLRGPIAGPSIRPILKHEAPVVAQGKYLFTSESVSMGHPDKLADQISDGVLDAYLAQDPRSRVACETMVTTGLAVIAGEITSKGTIDYQQVVRNVIRDVGYTDDEMGIAADTCSVLVAVGKQSGDIAMGVNEDESKGKDIGAGDQGLMFGYACNETPEMMPLPIALSHRILNRLTEARQKGEVDWLRPDSKSQVTIEYDGKKPVRVDTIVVSTQHAPHVSNEEIRGFVIEKVIKPLLPKNLDTSAFTFELLHTPHRNNRGRPVDHNRKTNSLCSGKSPRMRIGAEGGIRSLEWHHFGQRRSTICIRDVSLLGRFHHVAASPQIVKCVID